MTDGVFSISPLVCFVCPASTERFWDIVISKNGRKDDETARMMCDGLNSERREWWENLCP